MYQPDEKTLQKYADLLVKFALSGGKGVKKGETVMVSIPEAAKIFIPHLRRSILASGAHMLLMYGADDVAHHEYYELAAEHQLDHFPAKFYKGLIDQIDHSIFIIAEHDKYELSGVDSAKIMRKSQTFKPYMQWRNEKENKGKFSWTLAAFATPAMAKDVGMSLEKYWEQIILGCYLDEKDPIAKWRSIVAEQKRLIRVLNALKIEWLHVEGDNVDLKVKLGVDRGWLGGRGANIPSFELFISPDWRGTEGTIAFNQPLYRYGNVVEGIKLKFEKGRVVKATAKKNQKILTDMIAVENADKIGEYSLTDGRMSRITKLMGETLFDENFGGKQGNTHMALGNAYQESYRGDPSKVSKKQWEKMGFNESAVHTDIISTERRKVTATLPDGSKKVIYQDGQFKL